MVVVWLAPLSSLLFIMRALSVHLRHLLYVGGKLSSCMLIGCHILMAHSLTHITELHLMLFLLFEVQLVLVDHPIFGEALVD